MSSNSVLLSSISLFSVCWISTCAATNTQQLESKFALSQPEAELILNTGRVDDFAKLKEEGVTVQEFIQGVNQKLTAQQMIIRHQHPCYDRLKSVTETPSANDLMVGDCLITLGMNEFNKQQLRAAAFLMQTPTPTSIEIAAVDYLMNADPAVITTPATPTKDQITATSYLMQTRPSVIKTPAKPTANQIDATVRLQGSPFYISAPSVNEIVTGDQLVSIKIPDFTPQQFAAIYYLMHTLKPAIAKPTLEQITAMLNMQDPSFNINLPAAKDVAAMSHLLTIGIPNFTPAQLTAANYLMNNPTVKLTKPTATQIDATALLQTAQFGVATIKEPNRSQIDAVVSGSTSAIKREIAWALQHVFNGKEPGSFPAGVAKVVPAADDHAGVHDFEIVWTSSNHEAFDINNFRVDAEHLPQEAFPNLKNGDLVIFSDILHDPSDETKFILANAAQHP